jgi:RNA polymerase sigma factor (sigma-70 family)
MAAEDTAQAVRGEDGEFAELCASVHGRLVGILTLYTGDEELAHDLAQETLARLWRDWRRVRRATSPEAYAFRSAINLAKNHFRWQAVRRAYRGRLAADHPSVHEDPDVVDRVAVRAAVAALRSRQRTALVLRYYAGQPVAETARLMGVPENTVKTLTRRALIRLRGMLAIEAAEEAPHDA